MPSRVKKAATAVSETATAVSETAAPAPEIKSTPKKRAAKPKPAATTATTATETVATETVTTETVAAQKKKKPNKKTDEPNTIIVESVTTTEYATATSATSATTSIKKRGRKPKGGKLIQNLMNDNATVGVLPNIILHLKCSATDIQSDAMIVSNDSFKPGDVVSFSAMDPKGSDLNDSYQSQINTIVSGGGGGGGGEGGGDNNSKTSRDMLIGTNAYSYLNGNGSDDDDDDDDDGNHSTKDILKKLNHLKTSFHRSDVFQAIGAAPRRSCCFWDTCEFDTPPIYLPKSVSNNGGYVVYACFCSPECALAYLMNERVDTSVKFERCQMLNAMHGKINVSIKPAPNPQYTLNKFYGNLSIQEYRKLFKSEQIVYVVSKPLTHILPEIYEENNDFMLNNKIIPTNNYKPKKKTSAFG